MEFRKGGRITGIYWGPARGLIGKVDSIMTTPTGKILRILVEHSGNLDYAKPGELLLMSEKDAERYCIGE